MSFDDERPSERIDTQCTAAWEAFEASASPDSEQAREQQRIDRVRVRGYAIATLRLAEQSALELEQAGAALDRARRKAERAKKAMEQALAEAEAVARVAVSGDDAWISEVAQCLEECFG